MNLIDRSQDEGLMKETAPGTTGLVAVTGATGYVGGRLVPRLLQSGLAVRCVVRHAEKLENRPWRNEVEVVEADLSVPDQVSNALNGVQAAYYLVHSMNSSEDFEELELRMAEIFAESAAAADLDQIVYLGGLGHDSERHSAHLASRHRVGIALAEGGTPVTELRAAVIIGSGSASFEMLRSLVEVLPVMIVPRWVTKTRCQPIAIEDVLEYLVGVLGSEPALGQIFEIGGPEILTYRQMMDGYADVAGLRRRIILPVPVLTPRLSSHWVNLVSPLPIQLARSLIGSLTSDVVVGDRSIERIGHRPSYRLAQAIERSVSSVRDLELPTRWTDASGELKSAAGAALPKPGDPSWSGGLVLEDIRCQTTSASREDLMAVIRSVGGDNGWFAFNRLWSIRGFIDKIIGGVGLRRGRRHPTDLRPGDTVDFFSVVAIDDSSIRLRAEMRLPGHAWLEWEVESGAAQTVVRQRALFVPRGLLGRIYWYALLPAHIPIFGKMLSGIVAAAEGRQNHQEGAP